MVWMVLILPLISSYINLFFKPFSKGSKCYIVICWFMQKYTYICWIHTDAMITDARRKTQWQRRNDKQKQDKDRRRKTSLTKYLPLTLFVSFERVVQSLHVRGSWRPNITEIFWPQSYGRQHCLSRSPLLLNRSPGIHCPGCWLSLLHLVYLISKYTAYPPSCLSAFCSIRRPYITFKLPRGDMDTPPRHCNFFRYLVTGMCHFRYLLEWPVWSSSSGNNCHAVQRSLSSGASVYESIMGFFFFFFTSSHFISQFPPMRFPLITAIRMCHFLPVHHLEWHFLAGSTGQNITQIQLESTLYSCFTARWLILIVVGSLGRIPKDFIIIHWINNYKKSSGSHEIMWI